MSNGTDTSLCHFDVGGLHGRYRCATTRKCLARSSALGLWAVVIVQDLAVAAPVLREVEDDAFVLAAGVTIASGNVGTGLASRE